MLVRLFLAGESLPLTIAGNALEEVDPHELAATGLLTVRGDVVRARLTLEPFEGLLLASDLSAARNKKAHVLQIGPATRTLAALTVRLPVEATLDLGTGSGIQAFLAARHSERVVGTDVNARALRVARLNAALNGVENIEWRQGDLFEPVRDEQFGLVAANPPFVVSPVHELTYRDGGLAGDEFSRQAVTGAARHLHEGGFASVMCNWVSEPGGERLATPRRWLEGSGCDVWVLELATEGPVTYAMLWNGLRGRSPAAVARAAEPWLADYRARGIEAISTGAIVIRKRTGKNWARLDELGIPRGVRRGLTSRGSSPARISSTRSTTSGCCSPLALALAPETLLVERRLPGGALERARVTVEQGIPLPGRVPVAVAPVLAALDGGGRSETSSTPRRAPPASRRRRCPPSASPALRDLLARGLLVAGR